MFRSALRSFVFVLLVIAAGSQWIRAEDPDRIGLKLSFSTDGGKTFSTGPQDMSRSRILKVKVTWDAPRPPGENDSSTSVMFCRESDFASALTGKQKWNGFEAWYQRSTPQYLPCDEPQEFVYDLDLGARPEGAMGVLNHWDPVAKTQVNAPLPACPALRPGKYTFVIRVNYWLRKTNPARRVEGETKFALNIAPPASAAR